MSTKSELAAKYQKLSDREHCLVRPDMYIGSIENNPMNMWVWDGAEGAVRERAITCNLGLFRIFDEIVVNARDHCIRVQQAMAAGEAGQTAVTQISVAIREDGSVLVQNNGTGIHVEKHPVHHVYIPELIFGHLRTSENYNDDNKRIIGGRNGLGAKLTIVYSTWAKIETVDGGRKLLYRQTFRDNLAVTEPPVVTKAPAGVKPYTLVEFMPDYARFGLAGGLTPEMRAMFERRVYDICAMTPKNVKVSLNDVVLPVKTFKQYLDLYLGADAPRAYEEAGERWEYAVALSPRGDEFKQVSFVNGIFTRAGGKHVDYILNQVTRKVAAYIEKKKKVTVTPNSIKENIMLFLRCDIENPMFDSQSKDTMTLNVNKFGSVCAVSDGFCEKVAKMGVMDRACAIQEARENRAVAKKTDGVKTRTILGIANFIDANYAGTARSGECTLILCEGLSAQAGVVSGLSSADRNVIGIYPLKGKLLNVRGENVTKIAANKEITDLKRILGLENGRVYATMDDVRARLRYGRVMVLTDADADGSHIKALCVNLFHCQWDSLCKLDGFLCFMNTPILRAAKGKATQSFYNIREYEDWKATVGAAEAARWTIKYFKGLGTSTAAEFKEYFAAPRRVDFAYEAAADNRIDQIFNKKRADERKTWLEQYDKTAALDTTAPRVSYTDFIDKELIHFSVYDCERSIPNVMDGLKISLRKILFAAFKRRMTKEVKVAQFAGYVAEHSCYHHGEASLNAAIVGMAQNFVGSNNINLLEPKGQFGTAIHGGADSASERYIFTHLTPITRAIFPEADDSILTYLDDDGVPVEPEYYLPIIPFILVNGAAGIGTGFSTSIPPYNPRDIIQVLRAKLRGGAAEAAELAAAMMPYYEGFGGEVSAGAAGRYVVRGRFHKEGADKIVITELPVGTWVMPYIDFLHELATDTVTAGGKKVPAIVSDVVNLSTTNKVHIEVKFVWGKLAALEAAAGGVEKALKLCGSESVSNMHAFRADLKLHRYASVGEIIDDWYGVRLDGYRRRKAAQLAEMGARLARLTNKVKYIELVLSGDVDLRRKTAAEVAEMLAGFGLAAEDGDYKYLTRMPMDSVSAENVAALRAEMTALDQKVNELRAKSEEAIWFDELDELENCFLEYQAARRAAMMDEGAGEASAGVSSSGSKGKKVVLRKK